MKNHLNTLFVTTQGAYLAQEGEAVVVRVEKTTRFRAPIHTIGGIVCFGRIGCSPRLMGMCGKRNVAISFLTENGRFLAKVDGPVSGNVLLRRTQYRYADDEKKTAQIAAAIVAAKIANSRTVIMRALRDRPDTTHAPALEAAARTLGMSLDPLDKDLPPERIRGIEGDAARVYFDVFDHLITAQKDDFFFRERNRRPPLDNVNALLSFVYTLLAHDVTSALETVGLDPQVGFLHRDRPGRPSLSLDIMEEFRPVLADRLVLSLINLKQIQSDGFKKTEPGAVNMDDGTRKTLLATYQKRKQDEIRHPFLNEQVSIGLLVHIQARLLARFLRGDIDAYPPFIWK